MFVDLLYIDQEEQNNIVINDVPLEQVNYILLSGIVTPRLEIGQINLVNYK